MLAASIYHIHNVTPVHSATESVDRGEAESIPEVVLGDFSRAVLFLAGISTFRLFKVQNKQAQTTTGRISPHTSTAISLEASEAVTAIENGVTRLFVVRFSLRESNGRISRKS